MDLRELATAGHVTVQHLLPHLMLCTNKIQYPGAAAHGCILVGVSGSLTLVILQYLLNQNVTSDLVCNIRAAKFFNLLVSSEA